MSAIADASIRSALLNIAQQIFPLTTWTKDYVPPDAADLPWRTAGHTLSLDTMRTIDRFEVLIDSNTDEEALRVRLNKIAAAPLWLEPSLPHPYDWRSRRGLDDMAVFAPVDSDNFVIGTEDPKSKTKKPRARAEFYAACWPFLTAALAESLFPDATSWLDFAKSLYGDGLSAWPSNAPVKSSDFIKRYTKDIAICLLDLENPFFSLNDTGELWQRAVLIEAGEHRHRHNAYTPAQVQITVDQIDAKLTSLL